MAIPQGATAVTYSIALSGSGAPDWYLAFTQRLAFSPIKDAQVHAALEAGADAIVAHLQSEFPDATVAAQRSYDATLPGDPWPV